MITKSKYNAHTQPLFYSTGILPLPELILQQKLQFMHLFNHSLLPSSFDELFVGNVSLFGNLYFMRNLNDFYVPGVRTEFLRRFPFYSFPTAWNFLSSEFKEIAQKSIFKQSLKAKLLDNLKHFQCEKLFYNSCSSSFNSPRRIPCTFMNFNLSRNSSSLQPISSMDSSIHLIKLSSLQLTFCSKGLRVKQPLAINVPLSQVS